MFEIKKYLPKAFLINLTISNILFLFLIFVLTKLLMVVGETGAIGAHVVYRVGLALVSGAGNATIHPQAPVVNLVRDLLSQTSLVTRDFVLVCVDIAF